MNRGNCESCQLRTELCGLAEGIEQDLTTAIAAAEVAEALEAGARTAVDELGRITASNPPVNKTPEARARCEALFTSAVATRLAESILEKLLADSAKAGYFATALPRDCSGPGLLTGRCRAPERAPAQAAAKEMRKSQGPGAPGNPLNQ